VIYIKQVVTATKREIHTVSRCNIGGDSECKVSGVAKRGGKQQQEREGEQQRVKRESSGRRARERVSERRARERVMRGGSLRGELELRFANRRLGFHFSVKFSTR
jgi:hypothetical protein